MAQQHWDDEELLDDDLPDGMPSKVDIPPDPWRDAERHQADAEDYKPAIDSADELSDYERRTHGDNRRI